MKNKFRTVQIPMQTRLATVQPKTLNEEKRTVEVVFTTGARVRRSNFFDGPFIEELGLKRDEINMSRLKNKAPFLDTHGFGEKRGVRNVLGVVESASLIPGKEGRAVIRFSKRDEVEDIFQDVRDGILSNVSVGYSTEEIKKVGERDGIPIFRATKWTPGEISLVSMGADPQAQVRSEDIPTTECKIFENENEVEKPIEDNNIRQPEIEGELKISEQEKVAQSEKVRQTKPIGEINMNKEEMEKAAKEAGLKARQEEKSRQIEIRSIVSKVGLDEKLATEYIDKDTSIEDVRTLVIDALAEKDKAPENNTSAVNEVRIGDDLAQKGRIEGMTSALLHRFRPQDETTIHEGKEIKLRGHTLLDSGRPYAFRSLIDIARMCLEGNNIRTEMMSKSTIANVAFGIERVRGFHSTSDFPLILENVLNKTLRDGYLSAPQTWKPIVREVFVDDFKQISRVNFGDSGKLLKLEEGSEVKKMTMSEAAEKYEVEEYARSIALTRKTIINDDLDAFSRIPERMGRRASDLESDLIWDIIKANANLADGNALFSAAHGNLSTVPAAPSEVGLSELRKLMRRQVGLDGAEISLTPVWIFVPPEHETVAEKLIASIVPDSSTNVSPFSSAGRTPLRLDVEPRLETGVDGSLTAWYGTADKGQVDMLELARLSGSNGPQTISREGFEVNGMEIKIMHDVGAKAIEHRGLFKNAGA